MGNEIEVRKEPEMPELNIEIVKKYICKEATEQEIYTFIQICKAQKLNPFLREIYLVKYGSLPATIVTGKETFMKRADKLPQYDGFKAGIIVLSSDKIIYREGSFYTSAEEVLGGWAEVYVKGKAVPYRNEVTIEEYEGKKADGTTSKMWREKKGTMIRKVALVQSLREAFPDAFAGLYSPEEINTVGILPTYEIGKSPVNVIQPPSQIKTPRSKSGQATTAEAETVENVENLVKVRTVITNVTQLVCKNQNIKYTVHADNEKWSTFDVNMATLAKSFSGTGIIVEITHKQDTYKTIKSIDTLPGETSDPELSRLAEEAEEGLNL